MSYRIIKPSELIKIENQGNYKLVYIDSIPATVSDWTEETKKYLESPEYERDKEIYGWYNPRIRSMELPNPEYVDFKATHYAYFVDTPNMGAVWGDDFDDAPYDCNSGIPYDCTYTPDRKEVEVLQVPFYSPTCIDDCDKFTAFIPCEYPIVNCPWSTEDICLGAIPWIFARTYHRKGNNKAVSMMAGISPIEFIEKLKDCYNLALELGWRPGTKTDDYIL